MHQQRNPYLCIMIVGTFGLVTVIGVVGLMILSFANREPNSAVVGIIGTAIGSLGTFLVTPPRGSLGLGHDAPAAPAASSSATTARKD